MAAIPSSSTAEPLAEESAKPNATDSEQRSSIRKKNCILEEEGEEEEDGTPVKIRREEEGERNEDAQQCDVLQTHSMSLRSLQEMVRNAGRLPVLRFWMRHDQAYSGTNAETLYKSSLVRRPGIKRSPHCRWWDYWRVDDPYPLNGHELICSNWVKRFRQHKFLLYLLILES